MLTLAAALRQAGLATTWNEARRMCSAGRVTVDGTLELDPTRRVSPSAKLALQASRPPPTLADPYRLVFEDSNVLVVSKSAGVVTSPHARERGTLIDLL